MQEGKRDCHNQGDVDAVQWLAPLGIFRFSYGFPLNPKDGSATRYGDETEGFQFTVGSAF